VLGEKIRKGQQVSAKGESGLERRRSTNSTGVGKHHLSKPNNGELDEDRVNKSRASSQGYRGQSCLCRGRETARRGGFLQGGEIQKDNCEV